MHNKSGKEKMKPRLAVDNAQALEHRALCLVGSSAAVAVGGSKRWSTGPGVLKRALSGRENTSWKGNRARISKTIRSRAQRGRLLSDEI